MEWTIEKKDEQKFLAKRNAYFKFSTKEPLQRIEFWNNPTAAWTACNLFKLGSHINNSLDLAQSLNQMKPIEPQSLEASEDYLLEIPILDQPSGSVQVRAMDMLANEETPNPKVRWSYEKPLTNTDVHDISAEFEEASLIAKDWQRGDLKPREVLFELTRTRPTNSSRLNHLEIKFTDDWHWDKVHHAMAAIPGDWKNPDQTFNIKNSLVRFDFNDLDLTPLEGQNENLYKRELLVTLYDPLEKSLALRLAIWIDTKKPQIEIKRLDPEREYHRVDSWKEIDLRVVSDEELKELTATINGRKLELQKVQGQTSQPSITYQIRFDELEKLIELNDGPYEVQVAALDSAGNSTRGMIGLSINRGPPEIAFRQEDKVSHAVLIEGPQLLMVITDKNGLNYSNAKITFHIKGQAQPIGFDLAPPDLDSLTPGLHTVNLQEKMPKACEGELTVSIADQFDWPASMSRYFKYSPSKPRREPLVEFKGMDFVLVEPPGSQGEDQAFYLSKYEIPWAIAKQLYPKVKSKYMGPTGELPEYRSENNTWQKGDQFPAVGYKPEEAEKIAEEVFNGRLPTDEEYLAAARPEAENRNSRYPWRDDDKRSGRLIALCSQSWRDPESAFYQKHFPDMRYLFSQKMEFKTIRTHVVEVRFDPLQAKPELGPKLKYSGKFLHLIGNVGEMVKSKDARSYVVIGGDSFTNYGDIDLQRQSPVKFEDPSFGIGFRVVISLQNPDKLDPEFIAKAKGQFKGQEDTKNGTRRSKK